MASTSALELAQDVIDGCLRDGTWPARSLDALIERGLDEDDPWRATAATRALFSVVIERLGDLFEPALCDVYARLFSHIIARALPDYDPGELELRYRNIRQVRRFLGGEVTRVFVLSRVTLGADVAVTSVVLHAAKERFPDAEICLVGPEKNAALFADDARIVSLPVTYGRGSLLRDRLAAASELHTLVSCQGAIVIDPDSRLTQLGLIPVCDDAHYFFFESRAYGGQMETGLPALTSAWLHEVFGVEGARPYVAPALQEQIAPITVSLGVGDNDGKRLDDFFETQVLAALLSTGRAILLDRGAGEEESQRADQLAEQFGRTAQLRLHDGSFASFSSHVLQSKLFVGYDSAGQHVAAACGVPSIAVFAGYASERTYHRWRPHNDFSHVIAVDEQSKSTALNRTLAAISAEVAAHLV